MMNMLFWFLYVTRVIRLHVDRFLQEIELLIMAQAAHVLYLLIVLQNGLYTFIQTLVDTLAQWWGVFLKLESTGNLQDI